MGNDDACSTCTPRQRGLSRHPLANQMRRPRRRMPPPPPREGCPRAASARRSCGRSRPTACLLCGETGSGKSTQVPQMIHDALRDGELHAGSRARFVLCSEPRRLAVVRAPLQCLAARRCRPAAAACASAAQSGLGGRTTAGRVQAAGYRVRARRGRRRSRPRWRRSARSSWAAPRVTTSGRTTAPRPRQACCSAPRPVAPTRAPPHTTHTPRGDNLARRTTDCV